MILAGLVKLAPDRSLQSRAVNGLKSRQEQLIRAHASPACLDESRGNAIHFQTSEPLQAAGRRFTYHRRRYSVFRSGKSQRFSAKTPNDRDGKDTRVHCRAFFLKMVQGTQLRR